MQLFALSTHKRGVMQSWRWASIGVVIVVARCLFWFRHCAGVARGNVPPSIRGITRTPVSRNLSPHHSERGIRTQHGPRVVLQGSYWYPTCQQVVQSGFSSSRLDNRKFCCYIDGHWHDMSSRDKKKKRTSAFPTLLASTHRLIVGCHR